MPVSTARRIVKVKAKFQITLPTALCLRYGISVGDLFEASLTKKGILLEPKTLVDRSTRLDILRGLADVKTGRVIGPFKNVAEMKRASAKPRKM